MDTSGSVERNPEGCEQSTAVEEYMTPEQLNTLLDDLNFDKELTLVDFMRKCLDVELGQIDAADVPSLSETRVELEAMIEDCPFLVASY